MTIVTVEGTTAPRITSREAGGPLSATLPLEGQHNPQLVVWVNGTVGLPPFLDLGSRSVVDPPKQNGLSGAPFVYRFAKEEIVWATPKCCPQILDTSRSVGFAAGTLRKNQDTGDNKHEQTR